MLELFKMAAPLPYPLCFMIRLDSGVPVRNGTIDACNESAHVGVLPNTRQDDIGVSTL
jgi:hypothetical protein